MTSADRAETQHGWLSYRFRDPSLLDEALTHKSYVNESKSVALRHNERLEFLGDAVLSLIITEHLAIRYPSMREGMLSKLKAGLVSEVSLAAAARRLNLGPRLRLGRGEERSRGREKSSLLANALEALIAAVYLDGGLEASRLFVLDVLGEELQKTELMRTNPGGDDYKTRLQEWCQKHRKSLPLYRTVQETGPDHRKVFGVEVIMEGMTIGTGQGLSKKEAEQEAARSALERLIQ